MQGGELERQWVWHKLQEFQYDKDPSRFLAWVEGLGEYEKAELEAVQKYMEQRILKAEEKRMRRRQRNRERESVT